MAEDLAAEVAAALEVDPEEFRERAHADAGLVRQELGNGTFDNHQSMVGLEYEFYAVSDGRWEPGDNACSLMRVPRRLLEYIGFEKELGLHNAEMCTGPQPFNAPGLQAQAAEVRSRLRAALECTSAEGVRLVSDGMWTIPPAGETTREYLAGEVTDRGVRVATNMSDAVRYHAMANGTKAPDTFAIDAPHVRLSARTVMPESLITSIQPHYQVRQAEDLAGRHNYALRIAGPLLALGANAPFFPPDLYDESIDTETLLADGHHDHRIAVFESVLNRATTTDKVSFPQDLDSTEEAVDRIANDEPLVPMPVDDSFAGRFDGEFATFRLKHGTYWRWVRPVFDGASRAAANARVEFRPVSAQPTVRDSIAFQATFAGLMEALPRTRHPVIDLEWRTARENFYAAAQDGLAANLEWVTTDGTATTDKEKLFVDLLNHAEAGLKDAGCSEKTAQKYIAPLRYRVTESITPADWKRRQVRKRLTDGQDLSDAIANTQRAYIKRQRNTLLEGSFADWGVPGCDG